MKSFLLLNTIFGIGLGHNWCVARTLGALFLLRVHGESKRNSNNSNKFMC